MTNNKLRIMVLYRRTDSILAELQKFLVSAEINVQFASFDICANTDIGKNLEAFVIFLNHPSCAHYSIYTILDLGLPVLILKCSEGGFSLGKLSLGDEVLSWPRDKHRLLNSLHKLTLQSRPIPLCVPKIECMQIVNSLSIHGVSALFLRTIEEIRRFSHSQAPVLIQGETGTGKELGARALHYLGPRREGPFIPVNCSSLPDSLFENEVFGHTKGAYTDAKESYSGLVAQAENGTLFFDEVDSLQPRAQASLLRYLQDKIYRPLGSSSYFIGKTSIVAATNQNLDRLVSDGKFRDDLLYRINTIKINFPSLRERPEDITLLARIFLRKLSEQYDQPPKSFHPDTLRWFETQRWPGNVRQLENCVHRAFLLSQSAFIRIDDQQRRSSGAEHPTVHLPNSITDFRFNEMRDVIIKKFERQYLHRLMVLTQGNVSQAARLADKERRCLGRLLKKHGINREDYLGGSVAKNGLRSNKYPP